MFGFNNGIGDWGLGIGIGDWPLADYLAGSWLVAFWLRDSRAGPSVFFSLPTLPLTSSPVIVTRSRVKVQRSYQVVSYCYYYSTTKWQGKARKRKEKEGKVEGAKL